MKYSDATESYVVLILRRVDTKYGMKGYSFFALELLTIYQLRDFVAFLIYTASVNRRIIQDNSTMDKKIQKIK